VLARLRLWRAIVLGKNPLVRRNHQVQGAFVILAIVVSACAVPYAAGMRGTYSTANTRAIAEQAATRHRADAIAVADSSSVTNRFNAVRTVQARWVANAELRTDSVKTTRVLKAGDHFSMWIDTDGNPAAAPKEGSSASGNAAAAAVILWLCIAASCAGLVSIAGIALSRRRDREWDRELQEFAGRNDGWADRRS
jgi:hypothetical protein